MSECTPDDWAKVAAMVRHALATQASQEAAGVAEASDDA